MEVRVFCSSVVLVCLSLKKSETYTKPAPKRVPPMVPPMAHKMLVAVITDCRGEG